MLKPVRTQLIEAARAVMVGMVQEVTSVKVLSLHQDIGAITGEELVILLAEAPPVREIRSSK